MSEHEECDLCVKLQFCVSKLTQNKKNKNISKYASIFLKKLICHTKNKNTILVSKYLFSDNPTIVILR